MNGVKYVLYNIASFARWLAENLGPGARTGRTATGNREPLTLQKKKMSCMLSPRWSATGALTVPGLALMIMHVVDDEFSICLVTDACRD